MHFFVSLDASDVHIHFQRMNMFQFRGFISHFHVFFCGGGASHPTFLHGRGCPNLSGAEKTIAHITGWHALSQVLAAAMNVVVMAVNDHVR